MRSLVPLLVVALLVSGTPAGIAQADEPPFHELWRADRATGFGDWSLHGVRAVDGTLTLDLATPASGQTVEGLTSPPGPSGLALSPARETSAPFQELIASWNAETPPGAWIEVRLRARLDGDGSPDGPTGEGGRWTRWYDLGVWSTASGPERRQSVRGQRDDDGHVSTDTLVLAAPARAYQAALTLHADDVDAAVAGPDGGAPALSPAVSLVAVLASTPSPAARSLASSQTVWGTALDVPERSQMIYPNGGPVWCSPTSTSMVMAYWADQIGEPALDRRVPEVAAAVYDVVYRGNGNWPFNTAYAGRHGLTAYVSRMSSLVQVERWIEAGVPVVASLAWDPGELWNAAVPSTNGHLLVIVGFTAEGDVVVNDPAADPRLGLSVRRVYPRGALERLWLTHSGGTVYLIYPEGLQPPSPEAAFGAW